MGVVGFYRVLICSDLPFFDIWSCLRAVRHGPRAFRPVRTGEPDNVGGRSSLHGKNYAECFYAERQRKMDRKIGLPFLRKKAGSRGNVSAVCFSSENAAAERIVAQGRRTEVDAAEPGRLPAACRNEAPCPRVDAEGLGSSPALPSAGPRRAVRCGASSAPRRSTAFRSTTDCRFPERFGPLRAAGSRPGGRAPSI